MKKIIFIFCILSYLYGYGQRYDHLNVFDGRSVSDQNQIISDENNLYSLFNAWQDSVFLNNHFIANADKSNFNNMVLTKFKNNDAVKSIHFESYNTFGRIHLVNGKIWVTGSRQGDFLIDGELMYPSGPIPSGSVRDYFRGFILIYDKDLNLERDIILEADEYVKVVDHHDGKYYLGGNFGLRSATMTLNGVTIHDLNNSKNEVFLFTLSDSTYKAESGVSFGGPGREGLDRMHIDRDGNMILLGSTWSGSFHYKTSTFPTQGNFALSSFFLIKIDKYGEPVYFHSFDTGEGADNPDNRSPNLTVDEDGNLYIGTFGRVDKFKFDGQIIHQSTNNKNQSLPFMCITPSGGLKWVKYFEGSRQSGSIFNKSNILDNEVIFWGFSNRAQLIDDGETIQPNDTLQLSGMITLDKETGAFKSYQDIVTDFGSRLSDMEPLPNGNYMIWLTRFGLLGSAKDEPFFENQKNPRSSFIFEFNPEIPQLVSTIDVQSENLQKKFNIFPNPVSSGSIVNLEFPDTDLTDIQINEVDLYNINGILIQRYKLPESKLAIQLDSNLFPGIYLIKIKIGEESFYKKIRVL